MYSRTRSKRILALLLIGTFLLQQASWAAPLQGASAVSPQPAVLPFAAENPAGIAVPFEFVTLKEIHPSKNGRLIIHVQDAHANLSGQENAAGALESLMKAYGISLVFVEGGDRDVTLDDIRKMAPAEGWKIAAKRLLYEGIISGHEYLSLVSDQPLRLIGVEYEDLYMQNLDAYSGLVDRRKEALVYIHRIRTSLDRVKNKLYPKELLDYEALKDASHKRLLALARAARLDLARDFPELSRLAAIQDKENTMDFGKAGAEEEELLRQISIKGGPDAVRPLIAASKTAGESQVSNLLVLNRMLDLARENGVDTAPYAALLRYREYLAGFTSLDFSLVIDEMDEAETKVYEALLATDAAKKIRAIDRYVRLLEKGYNIQMSSKEFDLMNRNKGFFRDPAWQAFLNGELAKLGYVEDLVPYRACLADGQESLERFYDLVNRRDFVFMENIDRVMSEKNQKTAFLVTGGYHTQHLTELMREAGYGYVVLSPIVTAETDHAKYEELLLAPLEEARRQKSGEAAVASGKEPSAAPRATLDKARLLTEAGIIGLARVVRASPSLRTLLQGAGIPVPDLIAALTRSSRSRNSNPAPEPEAPPVIQQQRPVNPKQALLDFFRSRPELLQGRANAVSGVIETLGENYPWQNVLPALSGAEITGENAAAFEKDLTAVVSAYVVDTARRQGLPIPVAFMEPRSLAGFDSDTAAFGPARRELILSESLNNFVRDAKAALDSFLRQRQEARNQSAQKQESRAAKRLAVRDDANREMNAALINSMTALKGKMAMTEFAGRLDEWARQITDFDADGRWAFHLLHESMGEATAFRGAFIGYLSARLLERSVRMSASAERRVLSAAADEQAVWDAVEKTGASDAEIAAASLDGLVDMAIALNHRRALGTEIRPQDPALKALMQERQRTNAGVLDRSLPAAKPGPRLAPATQRQSPSSLPPTPSGTLREAGSRAGDVKRALSGQSVGPVAARDMADLVKDLLVEKPAAQFLVSFNVLPRRVRSDGAIFFFHLGEGKKGWLSQDETAELGLPGMGVERVPHEPSAEELAFRKVFGGIVGSDFAEVRDMLSKHDPFLMDDGTYDVETNGADEMLRHLVQAEVDESLHYRALGLEVGYTILWSQAAGAFIVKQQPTKLPDLPAVGVRAADLSRYSNDVLVRNYNGVVAQINRYRATGRVALEGGTALATGSFASDIYNRTLMPVYADMQTELSRRGYRVTPGARLKVSQAPAPAASGTRAAVALSAAFGTLSGFERRYRDEAAAASEDAQRTLLVRGLFVVRMLEPLAQATANGGVPVSEALFRTALQATRSGLITDLTSAFRPGPMTAPTIHQYRALLNRSLKNAYFDELADAVFAPAQGSRPALGEPVTDHGKYVRAYLDELLPATTRDRITDIQKFYDAILLIRASIAPTRAEAVRVLSGEMYTDMPGLIEEVTGRLDEFVFDEAKAFEMREIIHDSVSRKEDAYIPLVDQMSEVFSDAVKAGYAPEGYAGGSRATATDNLKAFLETGVDDAERESLKRLGRNLQQALPPGTDRLIWTATRDALAAFVDGVLSDPVLTPLRAKIANYLSQFLQEEGYYRFYSLEQLRDKIMRPGGASPYETRIWQAAKWFAESLNWTPEGVDELSVEILGTGTSLMVDDLELEDLRPQLSALAVDFAEAGSEEDAERVRKSLESLDVRIARAGEVRTKLLNPAEGAYSVLEIRRSLLAKLSAISLQIDETRRALYHQILNDLKQVNYENVDMYRFPEANLVSAFERMDGSFHSASHYVRAYQAASEFYKLEDYLRLLDPELNPNLPLMILRVREIRMSIELAQLIDESERGRYRLQHPPNLAEMDALSELGIEVGLHVEEGNWILEVGNRHFTHGAESLHTHPVDVTGRANPMASEADITLGASNFNEAGVMIVKNTRAAKGLAPYPTDANMEEYDARDAIQALFEANWAYSRGESTIGEFIALLKEKADILNRAGIDLEFIPRDQINTTAFHPDGTITVYASTGAEYTITPFSSQAPPAAGGEKTAAAASSAESLFDAESPFAPFVPKADAAALGAVLANPVLLQALLRAPGNEQYALEAGGAAAFFEAGTGEIRMSGSEDTPATAVVSPLDTRTLRAQPAAPMISTELPTAPLPASRTADPLAQRDSSSAEGIAGMVNAVLGLYPRAGVDRQMPIAHEINLDRLMAKIPVGSRPAFAAALGEGLSRFRSIQNDRFVFVSAAGETYGLVSDAVAEGTRVMALDDVNTADFAALGSREAGGLFFDLKDGNVINVLAAVGFNGLVGRMDMTKTDAVLGSRLEQFLRRLTGDSNLKVSWNDLRALQTISAEGKPIYQRLAIHGIQAALNLYIQAIRLANEMVKWAA